MLITVPCMRRIESAVGQIPCRHENATKRWDISRSFNFCVGYHGEVKVNLFDYVECIGIILPPKGQRLRTRYFQLS